MEKLLLLLSIILIGCSIDDTPNISSVIYRVEGEGIAQRLELSGNALFGEPDSRTTGAVKFENVELPFEHAIEQYHPHLMEIEVIIGLNDGNLVNSIEFIRNGSSIKKEVFDYDEAKSAFRSHVLWGVFLDD